MHKLRLFLVGNHNYLLNVIYMGFEIMATLCVGIHSLSPQAPYRTGVNNEEKYSVITTS